MDDKAIALGGAHELALDVQEQTRRIAYLAEAITQVFDSHVFNDEVARLGASKIDAFADIIGEAAVKASSDAENIELLLARASASN